MGGKTAKRGALGKGQPKGQPLIARTPPELPGRVNPIPYTLHADADRRPWEALESLGWTQEKIAGLVEMTRQRVQQIANNTNFGKICNLLAEGRDMTYVADHYHLDMALADRRGWRAS